MDFMPPNGEVSASLRLRSTGMTTAEAILSFHPEIKSQLDEVKKHGWVYLYIRNSATAECEVELPKSSYRITWGPQRYGGWDETAGREEQVRPPPEVIEVSLGSVPLEIKRMPEVQEFVVNICSKSFPRAATVDLAKSPGSVTFLNDPFWKWEVGSEVDEKKLSDAKEVYEIASWLIDEKNFRLAREVTEERYSELSYRFKKILGS